MDLKTYQMSDEQFAELKEISRPVPLIMLQRGMPPDAQEAANRFWERLGWRLGFDPATVIRSSRGPQFFGAEARKRTGEDALRDAAEADRVYQAQQDAWERAGDPVDYMAEPDEDDAEGCCFPDRCLMPGTHLRSECHDLAMMENLEEDRAGEEPGG